MADLTFSQSERRSFLIPGLIAVLVLGGIFAAIFWFSPHRVAGLTVTHVAILPNHTVFKSNTILVHTQDEAQDDLYVVANVRIEDQLRLPIFINDITATLITPQGDFTSSAIQPKDLPNLYVAFPKLKPLASDPLLRETAIQPGQHAEGMVLLHFPVPQSVWDLRTSATITVDLYNRGPQTVTIPKP